MRARSALSQTQRFVVFGVNCLIFYALFVWAAERWSVPGSGESLWLLSAIGWWTLGLLSAPWYRPPRDALGAAVAALLALFTLDLSTANASTLNLEAVRAVSVGYAVLVGVAALAAALLHERQNGLWARFTFTLAERLSSGAFLFGTAALISIFGFYKDPNKILMLSTAWLFFALIRPIELAAALVQDWRFAKIAEEFGEIGRLLRIDDPNIARASVTSDAAWKDGPHVVCLADGSQRYVIPLFTHIQNELVIGTGFITPEVPESLFPPVIGALFAASNAEREAQLVEALAGDGAQGARIVGFVVEGSQIDEIRFEVSVRSGLEEGCVVSCRIGGQRVYFQVINASTAEESFQQNPRGTHIVTAVQLGTWNSEKGFQKYGWLPAMNLPVFAIADAHAPATQMGHGDFAIGELPSAKLTVKAHLPDLVGYHTAVLGVTGTGKTEMALDLIREALAQNTKVFCVDLTGEYRMRLAAHAPQTIGPDAETATALEQKLFDVDTGTYGAPAEKKVLKTFLEEMRGTARQQVTEFLNAEGPGLAIFELAEVTNNRATLRTTELYLSEIMLWAKAHRRARRIFIVLEEAHTIIPETAGAGFDFDTQWVVGRIGQIALQGRKYGVGLLIVSQRTALVSKTILSQCNTFLTHALVDQTSLNFLANVFQGRYVDAIPNLRFLQFLAFGKGVASDRPLLLTRPFDQAKADAVSAMDRPITPPLEASEVAAEHFAAAGDNEVATS
jgi:uncharacterized protein